MVVHVCSAKNIYWNSVKAGSVFSNVKTDNRERSSDWYSFVWEERAHLTRTGSTEEHSNVRVSTVVYMIHYAWEESAKTCNCVYYQ